MRRRTKAIVGLAVAVAVAFFFAPVLYWYSLPSGPLYYGQPYPSVYRSLGCATLEIGTTYFPSTAGDYTGLHLSCADMSSEYPVG